MSKRIRTLILAAVATLAVAGVLVVLLLLPSATDDGDDTPEPDTSIVLVDQSANNSDDQPAVSAVTIQLAGETFTVEPNSEGIYTVAAYSDLPVYSTAIEDLLDALVTVEPLSQVAEQVDDPTEFGLGEAASVVTVTYTDGTTFALEIGNTDPTATGVYGREVGKEEVYLLGSSFVEIVTAPSTDYVGMTLTTAPTVADDDETGTAQLMKVVVSGPDRDTLTLRYRRVDDPDVLTLMSSYILTEPYEAATDLDTVSSWQTGFNSLSAAAVVCAHPTAQQLAEYGLAEPAATAKLTLGVCQTTTDDDSNLTDIQVYHATTYTFYLGNTDSTGSTAYLMLNGVDVVYQISLSSVPFFTASFDDLAQPLLFMVDIATVDEMSITAGDTAATFSLAHTDDEDENTNLTVTNNGETLDTANFRVLYQALMTVNRYKGVTKAESEEFLAASPTPSMTLTLTLAGGDTVTRTIYTYSANRSLVVSESGDRYLVKTVDVESAVRQFENYLAGKDVSSGL